MMRTLNNNITKNSIWLLSFLVTIFASSYTKAASTINQEALNMVADFADRICKNIPLEGTGSDLELSGNAKAELSGLINKIAELGIEGATKYKSLEYQGLLQKDLVTVLKASTECKLEVFKNLKDGLFIPHPITPPESISQDAVPTPRPSKRDPVPVPVPKPSKQISQITGIPLPGQPILVHGDFQDNQYREAMEILEDAAVRERRRVVRLEVIKWLNVADDEASRIRDGILWELQQRRVSVSYSTRQSDMSPTDPRREIPWIDIRDFRIEGVNPQGHRVFIIGYWAISQLASGSYGLLWVWAIVS